MAQAGWAKWPPLFAFPYTLLETKITHYLPKFAVPCRENFRPFMRPNTPLQQRTDSNMLADLHRRGLATDMARVPVMKFQQFKSK